MPTLSGLRRRGVTPQALRDFTERIGVAKNNSVVDLALLEYSIRQDLNQHARRVMGVLDPLKVTLVNYPEGQVDWLDAVNNPEDPAAGVRQVPFSRELWIEQDDFRETPPPKYFRLTVGREVRLRYGYYIKCVDVVKDADGQVIELLCTYDPETRGGSAPDGRKVKSTIHWLSAAHALPAEARLYDRLFVTENPDDVAEGGNWLDNLNPHSLEVRPCYVEPSVAGAAPGRSLPVRAPGLLLRRSRLHARQAGLQPHRRAEGRVGEGAAKAVGR